MKAGVVREAVGLFVKYRCALLACSRQSYLRVQISYSEHNRLWRDLLRVYGYALSLILIIGHRLTGDRNLDCISVRPSACPNAVPRVGRRIRNADCECRRCGQQKSEGVSAV
jgi:hypothetical protein